MEHLAAKESDILGDDGDQSRVKRRVNVGLSGWKPELQNGITGVLNCIAFD